MDSVNVTLIGIIILLGVVLVWTKISQYETPRNPASNRKIPKLPKQPKLPKIPKFSVKRPKNLITLGLLVGLLVLVFLKPEESDFNMIVSIKSLLLNKTVMFVGAGALFVVMVIVLYTKTSEKSNNFKKWIFWAVGILLLIGSGWYLLANFFPKVLGEVDISYTPIVIIEAIAPFVLVIPVYFLCYYATEGKRYKNKGYASTVSVVAFLMMLFVLYPQLLSFVFGPFLEHDIVGHVLEGALNTLFLVGLLLFVAVVLFAQGWAASGLIVLFLLFIYLYAVFIIC